jgi:AcrR family transcriptional regulator
MSDVLEPASDRRAFVLDAALRTFARYGYRKTSMDEVARGADISRPGLYFLFRSKEELFRAAVTQALEADLAAAEGILADAARPLAERLRDAFDRWAGRYIGPMTADITGVIQDNPALLGSIAQDAPLRFAALVTDAIAAELADAGRASAVAQTLLSTSIGLKHQVDDRADYLARLERAIGLLLR